MQSFWREMMTCRINKKQIICNKESKSGLEGGENTGNMSFWPVYKGVIVY